MINLVSSSNPVHVLHKKGPSGGYIDPSTERIIDLYYQKMLNADEPTSRGLLPVDSQSEQLNSSTTTNLDDMYLSSRIERPFPRDNAHQYEPHNSLEDILQSNRANNFASNLYSDNVGSVPSSGSQDQYKENWLRNQDSELAWIGQNNWSGYSGNNWVNDQLPHIRPIASACVAAELVAAKDAGLLRRGKTQNFVPPPLHETNASFTSYSSIYSPHKKTPEREARMRIWNAPDQEEHRAAACLWGHRAKEGVAKLRNILEMPNVYNDDSYKQTQPHMKHALTKYDNTISSGITKQYNSILDNSENSDKIEQYLENEKEGNIVPSYKSCCNNTNYSNRSVVSNDTVEKPESNITDSRLQTIDDLILSRGSSDEPFACQETSQILEDQCAVGQLLTGLSFPMVSPELVKKCYRLQSYQTNTRIETNKPSRSFASVAAEGMWKVPEILIAKFRKGLLGSVENEKSDKMESRSLEENESVFVPTSVSTSFSELKNSREIRKKSKNTEESKINEKTLINEYNDSFVKLDFQSKNQFSKEFASHQSLGFDINQLNGQRAKTNLTLEGNSGINQNIYIPGKYNDNDKFSNPIFSENGNSDRPPLLQELSRQRNCVRRSTGNMWPRQNEYTMNTINFETLPSLSNMDNKNMLFNDLNWNKLPEKQFELYKNTEVAGEWSPDNTNGIPENSTKSSLSNYMPQTSSLKFISQNAHSNFMQPAVSLRDLFAYEQNSTISSMASRSGELLASVSRLRSGADVTQTNPAFLESSPELEGSVNGFKSQFNNSTSCHGYLSHIENQPIIMAGNHDSDHSEHSIEPAQQIENLIKSIETNSNYKEDNTTLSDYKEEQLPHMKRENKWYAKPDDCQQYELAHQSVLYSEPQPSCSHPAMSKASIKGDNKTYNEKTNLNWITERHGSTFMNTTATKLDNWRYNDSHPERRWDENDATPKVKHSQHSLKSTDVDSEEVSILDTLASEFADLNRSSQILQNKNWRWSAESSDIWFNQKGIPSVFNQEPDMGSEWSNDMTLVDWNQERRDINYNPMNDLQYHVIPQADYYSQYRGTDWVDPNYIQILDNNWNSRLPMPSVNIGYNNTERTSLSFSNSGSCSQELPRVSFDVPSTSGSQECCSDVPKNEDSCAKSPRSRRSERSRRRGRTTTKYVCRIIIPSVIYKDIQFKSAKCLIGDKGVNTRRIYDMTQCKIRVRGTNSGALEGRDKTEAREPQMVCISSSDRDMFHIARKECMDLVRNMMFRFDEYCKVKYGESRVYQRNVEDLVEFL